MKIINVLIVDDSIYWADLNVRELKRAGFLVQHRIVACKKAMQKFLESEAWDIIISDNNMPGFNALQALEIRNQLSGSTPFIIVSEEVTERDIEKAFKDGCNDYINKEHIEILGQRVREIIATSGEAVAK